MAEGGIHSSLLEQLLDETPPLYEVCENARTSHWYNLGIELQLDEVKLEEIRHDAESDKRSRMYQLWLRSQPDATRRQLLTALRTKDVGEIVVARKYEEMLIEMVSLKFETELYLDTIMPSGSTY